MSDDVVLHSLSSSDTDQTDHISHYLSITAPQLSLSSCLLQSGRIVLQQPRYQPLSAGEMTNIGPDNPG